MGSILPLQHPKPDVLMEVFGARGRYAVGFGNSVPSDVPVENYLAMVEEAVTRRGLS